MKTGLRRTCLQTALLFFIHFSCVKTLNLHLGIPTSETNENSDCQSQFCKLLQTLEGHNSAFTYLHYNFKETGLLDDKETNLESSILLNFVRKHHFLLHKHFKNSYFAQLVVNENKNDTYLQKYRWSFFGHRLSHCKVYFHLDIDGFAGLWSTRVEFNLADILLLLEFQWTETDLLVYSLEMAPYLTAAPPLPEFFGFPKLIPLRILDFQQVTLLYHSRGMDGSLEELDAVQSSKLVSSFLKTNNLHSFQNLWYKLHSDMWGYRIWFQNPYTFRKWMIWTPNVVPEKACNHFYNTRREVEFQECSIILLRKYLNFTIMQGRPRLKLKLNFNIGTGLFCDFGKEKRPGWSCLGSATHSFHTGFIVFHRDIFELEVSGRLDGILKPFGRHVAVLILLSGFCLALFYSAIERNVKTVLANLVKLMLLFVDQGSSFKYKDFVGIMLWASWALVWLTISQIYRGDLFLSLTYKYEPAVPTDLDGLLASKVKLLTFDRTCTKKHSENSLVFCVKDVMLPQVLDAFSQNPKGYGYAKYVEFGNRLQTISNSNILNFLFGNSTKNLGQESKNSQIFGIVERSDMLVPLAEGLKIYTNFWASEFQKLSVFGGTLFVGTQEIYLTTLFEKYLGKLEQSGIPSMIHGKNKKMQLKSHLSILYRNVGGSKKSLEDLRRTELELGRRYIFCLEDCSSRAEGFKLNFKVIESEVFVIIFRYWLICLGVALIFLFIELNTENFYYRAGSFYCSLLSKVQSLASIIREFFL